LYRIPWGKVSKEKKTLLEQLVIFKCATHVSTQKPDLLTTCWLYGMNHLSYPVTQLTLGSHHSLSIQAAPTREDL
jgi:hypothetical protein